MVEDEAVGGMVVGRTRRGRRTRLTFPTTAASGVGLKGRDWGRLEGVGAAEALPTRKVVSWGQGKPAGRTRLAMLRAGPGSLAGGEDGEREAKRRKTEREVCFPFLASFWHVRRRGY